MRCHVLVLQQVNNIPNISQLFVLFRYHDRAGIFRQNGISSVYAVKEFGENFESYQKEQVLILDKENKENLHGKK